MTLSTEDRLDILELCARYNHAFDSADPEAFAATFTEDGVFGSIKGTEALRAFVPRRWERARVEDGARVIRHWNTSHVIEGDGDTARHSSYVLVLDIRGDDPSTISMMGIYEDILKKVNGAWKFVHREFIRDK